jgi:LysR family transcriptional regulator, glycine cleavage system transcriptional activator
VTFRARLTFVPTHRRPSPLALRAFEAAARHASFTEAARELHVTQAAVSRHVRALETSVGRKLFRRLYHRVELTASGKQLAGELAASFMRIDRALERARGVAIRRLRLTVEPAFASLWLVPRLGDFSSMHPDIELELETSDEVRSLGRDADVAIRYVAFGSRKQRGQGLHLFATDGIPVAKCTRTGAPEWHGDAAVLGRILLHDDDGRSWRSWFDAAQLTGFDEARHQYFSDYSLALSAARQGHGVTLAMSVFVEQELRDGLLLQLGRTRVPCGDYWLFQARDRSTAGVRGTFLRWLNAELGRGFGRGSTKVVSG